MSLKEARDILTKSNCIDNNNNCNVVRPFSKLELYAPHINPSTNNVYTLAERNEKINQHKNICELNNNNVGKCCDKNDPNLDKMIRNLPEDFKNKVKKIKLLKTRNNLNVMRICNESNCPKGYKSPTGYELCKLSNLDIDSKTKIAKNLLPDCINGTCNTELMPFIINKNDKESNYLEDINIVKIIKEDDLERFKLNINNNKKINGSINRVLTYGYPGNTLLHESVYQNSNKCIDYLLENINNEELNETNKDTNTPFQIACLKGNINLVNKLLKLGADIHLKNKYKETALYSAIRSNSIDIVRLLLLNGISMNEINKLGQTPLHVTVIIDDKNIDIIKLLIESGSEFLTKDNNDKNILQDLNTQEQTLVAKEINTYLTYVCFNKYRNDDKKYQSVLSEFPEFSPIDNSEYVEEESDQIMNFDNIPQSDVLETEDGIKIIYNEDLNNVDLYSAKERKPRKMLPLSAKKHTEDIVETFQININNINYLKIKLYMMYCLIFIIIVLILILYYN